MSPLDLFLHLCAAGCQFTRQGDTLRVHDPQHILTDALRQAIRTHKAALLAMLTPEGRIPLPRYPAPCWQCKGPSERQGLCGICCVSSVRSRLAPTTPFPQGEALAAECVALRESIYVQTPMQPCFSSRTKTGPPPSGRSQSSSCHIVSVQRGKLATSNDPAWGTLPGRSLRCHKETLGGSPYGPNLASMTVGDEQVWRIVTILTQSLPPRFRSS